MEKDRLQFFGERIRKAFLYGGIQKSIYEEIRPLRNEENYYSVKIGSLFAVAAGLVFMVLILCGFIRKEAMVVYISLTVMSLIIHLCCLFLMEGRRRFATALNYAFAAVLLIYAIEIGVIYVGDPSRVAVTFHVFIVLIPFLIVDAPVGLFSLLIFFCFLYNLINPFYKNPSAVRMDLINSLFFMVLSCTSAVVLGGRNMKRLANENYLFKEHDTDPATGLLREHAVETMINTYLSRRISGEEGHLVMICLFHNEEDETILPLARERIADTIRLHTGRYEFCAKINPDTWVIFYRECSRLDAELKKNRLEDAIMRSFAKAGIHLDVKAAAAGSEQYDSYERLSEAAWRMIFSENKGNRLPESSADHSVSA